MIEQQVRWSRRSRTLAVMVGLIGSACLHTDPGDCPSYDVQLKEPAAGFTRIGEVRADETCKLYCKAEYPVCKLESASLVKCQPPPCV